MDAYKGMIHSRLSKNHDSIVVHNDGTVEWERLRMYVVPPGIVAALVVALISGIAVWLIFPDISGRATPLVATVVSFVTATALFFMSLLLFDEVGLLDLEGRIKVSKFPQLFDQKTTDAISGMKSTKRTTRALIRVARAAKRTGTDSSRVRTLGGAQALQSLEHLLKEAAQ